VSGALAPIADKLGKCIRLLSSDRDGEVVAAAHAIRRVLRSAGLDVHALADQVENPPGNFNAAEARKLYDTGYMQGFRAATMANSQDRLRDIRSPLPSWHETALWCQRSERLRPREREFVDQMAAQTLWREPTERQRRWLKSIYHRLGGK